MKNWHEKSKPFKEFDVISQNEYLHLESIPYQLPDSVVWEHELGRYRYMGTLPT